MVSAGEEFEFVRDVDLEEMAGIGDGEVRQAHARAHVAAGVITLAEIVGTDAVVDWLEAMAVVLRRSGHAAPHLIQ